MMNQEKAFARGRRSGVAIIVLEGTALIILLLLLSCANGLGGRNIRKQQDYDHDHNQERHGGPDEEPSRFLRVFGSHKGEEQLILTSDYEDKNDDNHHKKKKQSNRVLLQASPRNTTSTTGVTTTNCSNTASDSFSTIIAISFEGNRSLITNDNVNRFASVFAKTYNSLTTTTDGNGIGDGTPVCDQLFRSINSVQATVNVSIPGLTNELVRQNESSLPIIPVRRRLGSDHFQEEDGEEENNPRQSSSFKNDVLWESLLQSHLVDIDGSDVQHTRKLQQVLPPPSTTTGSFPSQLTTTTNQTTTVANYNVIVVLLDISGVCRACRGDSDEFNLFDDIISTDDPILRERLILRRGLQQQQVQEDNGQRGDDDCTCPVNAISVNTNIFGTSFNKTIAGNTTTTTTNDPIIEFLNDGEIKDIFSVIERPCESKEQIFITTQFVSGIEFNPTLMLAQQEEGRNYIQQVEDLFRDSYNQIAQQLCDPLFRTIYEVQFVSYVDEYEEEEEEGENNNINNNNNGNGIKNTVTLEFIIEATCRGEECTKLGCLFDDDDDKSCDNVVVPQGQRHATVVEDIGRQTLVEETHYSQQQQQVSSTMESIDKTSNTPDTRHSRHLMEDDRCVCRKGRLTRPPNQDELKEVLQEGLDQISETFLCNDINNGNKLSDSCPCQNDLDCVNERCESGTCQAKLNSCSRCKNGSDCITGVCIGSICAETDGFLRNSCECLDHESCLSGRCKDLGLLCDTVCSDDDEGSSPVVCEELCYGICTEKISDTCIEPCVISRDCQSEICGTVVCLPESNNNNGLPALLVDGCFSSSDFECQSGLSENNVCVPSLGDVTTTAVPSVPPTTSTSSFSPTDAPTISVTTSESTISPTTISPTESTITSTAPTTLKPTTSPTTMPPLGDITTVPTVQPTTSTPTFSSTDSPTISTITSDPTISPTTISPTESPTTASTTLKPTASPTESPTTPPTTLKPTTSPTESPTTSPTTSPTVPPTPAPTSPPTDSPTTAPTTPPTDPPTPAPTPTPTISPTSSPTTPAPTAREPTTDCLTFKTNDSDGFGTVIDVGGILYNFCNSFEGIKKCCTDDNGEVSKDACNNLKQSGDAYNTLCKGSCRGVGSCSGFKPTVKPDGTVGLSIGSGSCIGEGACFESEAAIIGDGSCIGDKICARFGGIRMGDNACNLGCADCQNSIPDNQARCNILSTGIP